MKKSKTPYISPDNRMDPEKLENIDINNSKPVIEISETKQLLFITGAPYSLNGTDVHLMISIIYDTKLKTIELRGRWRYEKNGDKRQFGGKEAVIYTPLDLKEMKQEVVNLYAEFENQTPLIRLVKPPFQISFEIGEDMDSIIKKMNDSNEFDIGIVPNNKNK